MKKSVVIISIASFVVLLSILFSLVYLGYLPWWLFFVITGSVVLIGLLILGLWVYLKRKEENTDDETVHKQRLNRVDAKKLALEMVSKEYVDHLTDYKSDEILNVGQASNRTPIYHLSGIGELTKNRYDVLIRLDDPKEKSTILVNSLPEQLKDRLEMLSASPNVYDDRLIRTIDPFGRETMVQERSLSPEMLEKHREKAEKELRDAEVKE